MQFIMLLIVGVVFLYFGLKRRAKNLPLTDQYKQEIEKKYQIANEIGLRDFEEFAVIFLGFVCIIAAFGLKVMAFMAVSETAQMRIMIGTAVLLVLAYRTIRNSFLIKR